MENMEDFYKKQKANDNAVKIAARIKGYNNDVATIRSLIPVAISKIKANPPKLYYWVIIDGKECVSWPMCISDSEWSISMLQNGDLISIRREWEQGNYVWKFLDYVFINFIGESDEAAKSDYHGGYGYDGKNGKLGYYTILHLREEMAAESYLRFVQ